MTQSLTLAQVRQAIGALGNQVPRGEQRYQRLKAKLLELYGINNGWESDALTEFERWTGVAVRGVPAKGSAFAGVGARSSSSASTTNGKYSEYDFFTG